MFGKLLLLFVVVPLADMTLLLMLSSYIGWKISLALVIASGVLGAWLAKLSFRSVLNKLQSNQANSLQASSELLTDGMLIFFASGLLLTPGFITDTIGLTLLIPTCRKWYKARLTNWFRKNVNFQMTTFSTTNPANESGEGVVDGEVRKPGESTKATNESGRLLD